MLDRLLELRVPDQITLDADELVSLLEDGVGALRSAGSTCCGRAASGRDLTATTVLDRTPRHRARSQLIEGMLGPDALFAFNWQIALHGDPLTDEEMDQLAGAASPILKLRGSWTVVDPAIARKARKRLVRTVKPAQAVAAALTGVVQVDADAATGPRRTSRSWSAPAAARCASSSATAADPRADRAAGRPARDAARLPAARLHLARRADRRSASAPAWPTTWASARPSP